MNILLLGEYSGVHHNLKEGLLHLGHNVDIASYGDGWKKFHPDICLGDSRITLQGKTSRAVYPFFKQPSFYKYDIIQMINPIVYSRLTNNFLVHRLIDKFKGKIFLLGAGCDYFYYKTAKRMEYCPCFDCELVDLKTSCFWEKEKEFNSYVANRVNGIIPMLYEYAEAYRKYGFSNLLETIPFPMNLDKIRYNENNISDKLVIFHGLNRIGSKGTNIIKPAMLSAQNEYPDKVQAIIAGRLPINQYLEIMEKTNVVIDQAYSYSYGMNAVYAMAQGKVVFSGAEQESLNELKVQFNPIVNIRPDAKDIKQKIELFISNGKLVREVGYQSRKYVEQVHDYKRIAKLFYTTWINH